MLDSILNGISLTITLLWKTNLLILLLVLLFAFLFIIYFFIFTSMVGKKSKGINFKILPPLNYDNDINFLNKLIQEKIDTENKLFIQIERQRKTPFTFDLKEKIIERVISNIANSISPIYRQILMKYFSEDGLYEYISTKVILSINDILLNDIISKINVKK